MQDGERTRTELEDLPLDDRNLALEGHLEDILGEWRATQFDGQLSLILTVMLREGPTSHRWRDVQQGAPYAIGMGYAMSFLQWLSLPENLEPMSRVYPQLQRLLQELAGFAGAMKGLGDKLRETDG